MLAAAGLGALAVGAIWQLGVEPSARGGAGEPGRRSVAGAAEAEGPEPALAAVQEAVPAPGPPALSAQEAPDRSRPRPPELPFDLQVALGKVTREEVGDEAFDAALLRNVKAALVDVEHRREAWTLDRLGFRDAEHLAQVLGSPLLSDDQRVRLVEMQADYDRLFTTYQEARERAWLDPRSVGMFDPLDAAGVDAEQRFCASAGTRSQKTTRVGDRSIVFLFSEWSDRPFSKASAALLEPKLKLKAELRGLGLL